MLHSRHDACGKLRCDGSSAAWWARRTRWYGWTGGPLPSYYTNASTPLQDRRFRRNTIARAAPPGHARLVCLANNLKSGMFPGAAGQAAASIFPLPTLRDGATSPMGYRNRVGPTLAELTPAQRGAVKAILKTAAGITGGEGYDEIEQIQRG